MTLRLKVNQSLKGRIETESEKSPLNHFTNASATLGMKLERPRRRLPEKEVWIDYFVQESYPAGPLRESYQWPRPVLPPTSSRIKALHNKEVIAFLTVTESWGIPRYHFADYSPGVVVQANRKLVKAVANEIKHQSRIATAFTKSTLSTPDQFQDRVKSFIDQMTGDTTQHRAFFQLEMLGTNAIPSIIRLMDDRRPLGSKSMALRNNWPDAFEGYRQYGPELIVDALDAILNQLCGESFGQSWSENTDRSRAKSVAGWRVYLSYSDYVQEHEHFPSR